MEVIIDTNILLDNPKMILEYDNVLIPYAILQELDKFKNDPRKGYFAREVTRLIINNNIKCKNLGWEKDDLVDDFLIYLSTIGYKVITQDYLMYLKGKSLEGNIKLYDKKRKNIYSGVSKLELTPQQIDELYEKGQIKVDYNLSENEFVDADRVIGRYKNGYIQKVNWGLEVEGVGDLNRRQLMAADLLFDDDVKIISLWGNAGTGKTALAIKTAFQLFRRELYNEILISRPAVQIGTKEEQLGILPGNKEQKMSEHLMPFKDNMDSFQYKYFPEIQPLATIKGRDIKNTIFVIDEAQDIKSEDIILIIERISKGSKIIFTGDPNQIDREYLNYNNNGLAFLINSLKNDNIFGCIELLKNERSEVAKKGKLLRKKLKKGIF